MWFVSCTSFFLRFEKAQRNLQSRPTDTESHDECECVHANVATHLSLLAKSQSASAKFCIRNGLFMNALGAILQCIEDHTKKTRSSDIEDNATSTENKLSETEKLMQMLSEKVDDRSRR